jgi:S1-C subfamily serine protease
MNDGRVFQTRQIAADPISDLAVLKIDAANLPVAPIGDSSKLKAGMMVLAVGNALGEGISMTAGWVSQIGVSITLPAAESASSETLFDLIQISAPINPGNSGGPLIDMLGEVVGITNVKLVASQVENVGYAISTRSAMPIIEQLIETGQVVRPFMGVSLRTVTRDIASMLNLAVTEGALVTQVAQGGPASDAGLQQGDVITRMGDRDITSAAEAVEVIRSSQIDQQMEITFYRGNSQSTVQVTLAQNASP